MDNTNGQDSEVNGTGQVNIVHKISVHWFPLCCFLILLLGEGTVHYRFLEDKICRFYAEYLLRQAGRVRTDNAY